MLLEVVRLAADLIDRDIQTIVFGRARRTVEVMLRYLQSTAPGDDGRIRAYRSGYLPHLRREIEAGLRQGTVRTVVTTTALELGIDIGGMEAALLAGYPGTISGTWQQAGRAGRQAGASIAALVASPSPLDQFLARHPDYFFERSPEHALINPDNLLILLEHIRCATFELPFIEGEAFGQVSGEQVAQFLDLLEGTGELYRSGDRHFWMSDRYPAREVSLRSTSPEPVLLQIVEDDVPRVIGQVDHESAHWMVHPGAVYLHEGDQYLVEDLDLEAHLATLQARELDYYTEPQSETTVQLLARSDQAPVRGGIKAHGEVRVTCQIVGFRKVKWFTHEQLGLGQLDLPPTDLVTTGYWLSPSQETIADLRARGLWTNDPNDYGPNWDAQRQAARQRDGYRCQMCGTVERGSQHHVHHKVPFRAFDSYRQANQLANLTTLCPRCHRRAELSVHMRSGLAGLAFVLGHLAPLFLMCDARDIGVHADPRSPLAEGAPAVVVYDGVPAGIGFSQRLYQMHDALMAHARDLVAACPCLDGCPSCVGPAAEGGLGGKAATAALVEALVDPALLREGVT
jgi:DEAD/DEAH box helicase domain-containing protein